MATPMIKSVPCNFVHRASIGAINAGSDTASVDLEAKPLFSGNVTITINGQSATVETERLILALLALCKNAKLSGITADLNTHHAPRNTTSL